MKKNFDQIPEIEKASKEEIRKFQNGELQKLMTY